MNTLTYKGYTARVEFDGRDNILVGHVADIDDIIGFHAESVSELHAAFEEAVDDDLEACAKLAQEPNKPASGRLRPDQPGGPRRSGSAGAPQSPRTVDRS